MTNFNFKEFIFSLEDLFKSRGFSSDNLHSIDQVYILTGSINTIKKIPKDIQYTNDCKLKKICEMLLTTLEHNQHDDK
jgi:hypothetical protein